MDALEVIAVLENEVEAQLLDSMLDEQSIPHVLKCYRDSAYDGIFQSSRGWGHVEALGRHRAEVEAVLGDLRSPAGGDAH